MHHPEPQTLIEDGSFQGFLNEFGHLSPDQAALKARGKYAFYRELSTLLQVYRKAEKKIPDLLQILPALDQKSLEQCTSEVIAGYKARLFSSGKKLLSISGGLGIDERALSDNFEQVISLDPDVRLNRMVRYNWHKAQLGARISRLDLSAEEYLRLEPQHEFDCIYADPDRRSGKNKSDPGEHTPDVFALMDKLLQMSPEVWVKFSPLLDTAWLAQQAHVQEIWCLAQQHEMKEVLVKFGRESGQEIRYGSAHIKNDGSKDEFMFRGFRTNPIRELDVQAKWIYIPDAAMTHSRLSFECARERRLHCLSKSGQVFGSDVLHTSWPGRVYFHCAHFPFQLKKLQKYVEMEGISGSIFLLRGTSLRSETLRKQLKIKENGPDVLLFSRNSRQEIVFHLRENTDV